MVGVPALQPRACDFPDEAGNIFIVKPVLGCEREHPRAAGRSVFGVALNRWKLGGDVSLRPSLSVGASVNIVSSVHYVDDKCNQLAPLGGYTVVNLYSRDRPVHHLRLFISVENLHESHYATWGILSDPTGVGALGIASGAIANGPGVNNRFISPAAPLEVFGGVRVRF